MSKKLYAIIRSPIGYFEVAPAGFLKQNPPAQYQGFIEIATGKLVECRRGTVALNKARAQHAPKELSMEEVLVVLQKKKKIEAYPKIFENKKKEIEAYPTIFENKKKEIEAYPTIFENKKLRSTRIAVSRAFKNRDAHMDQPEAWTACAIALRRQADAEQDAGHGTMAKAVRSDAWDADEHALRLETHNNRESMTAFHEYRLRLEATGK
jgi:hypothetical protein